MPKGTVLEVVMYFDNSANNRSNPDPTAEVCFGDQTWEEMAFGFYTMFEASAEKTTTGGNSESRWDAGVVPWRLTPSRICFGYRPRPPTTGASIAALASHCA